MLTRPTPAPVPFTVRLVEAETMFIKGYRYALLTRVHGIPTTRYSKTLMGLCNLAIDDKGLGAPITIGNLIQYLTDQVKFEKEASQC